MLASTLAAAAALARLLAAHPALPDRDEQWTYRNGEHVIPVRVMVRGDDYRATVPIDGLTFASGRVHGKHWRADGNGVVHETQADLQGDPFDRLPEALFPLHRATLRVTRATEDGGRVEVEDREPETRAHWFVVDPVSGRIERESTREGRLAISYVFSYAARGDQFPSGWTVTDGETRDDLVVTRDASSPAVGPLAPLPAARTFSGPRHDTMHALQARFDENGDVSTMIDIAGHHVPFLIDTGTEDITLDDAHAFEWELQPALGHAAVSMIRVGDETLTNAAVSLFPMTGVAADGILGYDWFFGHIVHMNFRTQVLEVGDDAAAAAIFNDPATTVLPMNTHESIPFVPVTLDGARGDRFALDTGSPQLQVFAPFARAHPATTAAWSEARFPDELTHETESYLEGNIDVVARRVHAVQLGPVREDDVVAGLAQPTSQLDLPFDGIIGTELLKRCDLWFDYDHQRIGVRAAS
jgi:hypothetical protein